MQIWEQWLCLQFLKVVDVVVVVDVSTSTPWCSSAANSSINFETSKQYFWLYNVQSKGPKCQPTIGRLFSTASDPHVLPHFSDPVADVRPRTSVKCSGRQKDQAAAEADANPRRLLQIGSELQRLTAIIGASPSAAAEFSLSPREKNKFASRVCRLKRKAQHEANKIKLQGLEQEHRKWWWCWWLVVVRGVNETLQFKIETRLRLLVISPRWDETETKTFQNFWYIAVWDWDETVTSGY